MKILVIVKSKHIGNTMMIAEAMSEVAPVTICDLADVSYYKLNEYDIIGLGSGIYGGKHDKDLFKLVESFDNNSAYNFVFSTSGTGNKKYNEKLIKALESKNKIVIDSFACKGLDKFFIFKVVGGISKGHPDIDDFDSAQNFINQVINKYNQLKK
jgi:flavodoxin